jgi:hypothetical protein
MLRDGIPLVSLLSMTPIQNQELLAPSNLPVRQAGFKPSNFKLKAYSYLNPSTWFLRATLKPCQLTVSITFMRAVIPVRRKIHQLIGVL